MNSQLNTLSLVALIGWLILAVTGFASYKLSWKKSVSMALIWIAIFVGVALLFALLMGSASLGEAIGLSV